MDEIIAAALIIGLVPGLIARAKGHSFLLWWLFGAALWIVAFPMSLFLKNQTGKQCFQCREYIDKEARVCKYCQTVQI